MASDPLAPVRDQISREVEEILARCERLGPLDLHARLDSLRRLAEINGLAALEGLVRQGAQLALLPRHNVAIRHCLAHVADALESRASTDCTTILAAVAVRLH